MRVSVLVLLPGMDGSGDLFEEFAGSLREAAPGLSILVVRYPPDRPMGYAELVAYARSQLPAGQPYVVLGESFSGPVGIMLAAANPPGLAGLILCCTFARNPAPGLRLLRPILGWLPTKYVPPALLRFYLMGREAGAPLQARLETALSRLGPGVLAARMAAVLDIDATSQLAQVRVPALYLRATLDRLIAPGIAQGLRDILQSLQISDFSAPHLLLQTRPREAAARVLKFIEALGPTGVAA